MIRRYAGDSTTVAPSGFSFYRQRAPERLGVLRVLQDQRALQIAAAVETGGKAEVAF